MARIEPIYRSDGEWVAVYIEGHLFNVDGEWLGFVKGRNVFDTTGNYLGYFSDDRRLLRKRSLNDIPAREKVPPRPPRPQIPATMPLSTMMKSLPMGLIDMFEAYPEKLLYIADNRPDME